MDFEKEGFAALPGSSQLLPKIRTEFPAFRSRLLLDIRRFLTGRIVAQRHYRRDARYAAIPLARSSGRV